MLNSQRIQVVTYILLLSSWQAIGQSSMAQPSSNTKEAAEPTPNSKKDADPAKASEPSKPAGQPQLSTNDFDKTFAAAMRCLQEGKFKQGESLLKDTLKMESAQGASEVKRSQTCVALGDLFKTQKRYAESEALYRQALAKLETSKLEKDEPAVMCKLASLYKSQNKFPEALALYKEAMAIVKRNGAKAADEATIHANLGLLFQKMGKAKEAESEELTAIKMFDEAFGKESPEAAQCMTDLATFYMNEHKANKATPLLESALGIFEKKAAGKLSFAMCAEQLGTAYFSAGKYPEAESLARKALAIYQKLFGQDNMQVAITLSNLGYRLSKQGKNQEALDSFNKSISIQEKLMGASAPDLLANLHGMAEVYVSQAEYKKTEAVLRRELAIREKVWGPKHLSTVANLRNLANCLVLEGALASDYDPIFAKAEGILAEVPEEKRKMVDSIVGEDIVKGLDLSSKKKGKKQKNEVW